MQVSPLHNIATAVPSSSLAGLSLRLPLSADSRVNKQEQAA
jgi:hypothetical protein